MMPRYRTRSVEVEAERWNPWDRRGDVRPAKDCPHPYVRPATYADVATLQGTNGWSRDYPRWDWAVMGVVETRAGPLTISPGDWVVTGQDGLGVYPVDDDVFLTRYEPIPPPSEETPDAAVPDPIA